MCQTDVKEEKNEELPNAAMTNRLQRQNKTCHKSLMKFMEPPFDINQLISVYFFNLCLFIYFSFMEPACILRGEL